MVDFADFTQIEFINSLASSDPTPGGGSAAAGASAAAAPCCASLRSSKHQERYLRGERGV